MKRLISSVVIATCFSSNAFAAYLTVSGEVTMINNWEGHNGHLIRLSNMSSSSELCPRNDYYILHKDHMFVKENYSLLLSARVSGKPVIIQLSDSATNKCEDNFPRIFHIQF